MFESVQESFKEIRPCLGRKAFAVLQNRAVGMEDDPNRYYGKEEAAQSTSGSSIAIDSSNRGFQLLKKHGWTEGTGLGVSEQGRLEPVETYVKNNKRGLGADKGKKKILKPSDPGTAAERKNGKNDEHPPSTKKKKGPSKKMRKMQELEQRLQEKEFERAFFREFWPDNV